VLTAGRVDTMEVSDAHSQIVELVDLWTSGRGSSWGDVVPHRGVILRMVRCA
jgi:hypothetical protein